MQKWQQYTGVPEWIQFFKGIFCIIASTGIFRKSSKKMKSVIRVAVGGHKQSQKFFNIQLKKLLLNLVENYKNSSTYLCREKLGELKKIILFRIKFATYFNDIFIRLFYIYVYFQLYANHSVTCLHLYFMNLKLFHN